jgi:predicted DCC family thiol-disulfide oxidoreductase YuxK
MLQPCHVELRFLATSDPVVRELYGDQPWYKVELMILDDLGRGWVGPEAFLMCLWATKRWRSMSFRLTGTAFAPLAERFFHALSANRSLVSGMLSAHHCDGDTCHVEVAG